MLLLLGATYIWELPLDIIFPSIPSIAFAFALLFFLSSLLYSLVVVRTISGPRATQQTLLPPRHTAIRAFSLITTRSAALLFLCRFASRRGCVSRGRGTATRTKQQPLTSKYPKRKSPNRKLSAEATAINIHPRSRALSCS